MRGKWVLFSVAVALAGVGAGVLSIRSRRAGAVPAPPNRTAVIADQEITLQGIIRPQHVTGLASPVAGLVEELTGEIGQEVYQGQVLARVGAQALESAREAAVNDLERAQDQVAKAEAAVNSARLEESRADADAQRARLALDRAEKVYSRQRLLVAEGATPRLTFEKAEAEYQALTRETTIMEAGARAARDLMQEALRDLAAKRKILQERTQQVDEAKENLLTAEVRSPVDGIIVGRKAAIGKPADEAGNEFFQIATDLYALEVALEPKPQDLKRIQAGERALVLVLDLQSQGLPGAVRSVQGSQVLVEFECNLPGIKPGMLADVRLKLD